MAVISVSGRAKVHGHAEALASLIADRQQSMFAWGVHDCCLWASDAIHAQVGADPAALIRGRYATALQAARVIRACGPTLADIATAALGSPLRHPMLACAGDVGLVEIAGHDSDWPDALGVCIGEWWACPGRDGLTLQPMGAARISWRVGCA